MNKRQKEEEEEKNVNINQITAKRVMIQKKMWLMESLSAFDKRIISSDGEWKLKATMKNECFAMFIEK